MQAKKPKLILHFDVNKTIIFEDSCKGITGEEMVNPHTPAFLLTPLKVTKTNRKTGMG